MTEKEIQNHVRKCPYFGSPKTIDSRSSCKLEFHHRPICPSSDCLCAEKLGLKESVYGEVTDGAVGVGTRSLPHGCLYLNATKKVR